MDIEGGGAIMKGRPSNGLSKGRSPLTFLLLVFLLSVPFWVMGPVVERLLPGELPVDLPISALMGLAPVTAAAVLVRREGGSEAVKALLKGAFDYRRIRRKAWYVPILFYAMNNVTTVLLPVYGWPYDPFVALIILGVAAAIVTFLWGPKTLARYRYARRGTNALDEGKSMKSQLSRQRRENCFHGLMSVRSTTKSRPR